MTPEDRDRRKSETIAAIKAALEHAQNGFPNSAAHFARQAHRAAIAWADGKPYSKRTAKAPKKPR